MGQGARAAEVIATLWLRAGTTDAAAAYQRRVQKELAEAADGAPVTVRVRTLYPYARRSDFGAVLYKAIDDVFGTDVSPFFDSFEHRGERLIVLPTVALTVHEGGELTDVYPRWKEGRVVDVLDGIETLAERAIPLLD